MGLFDSEIVPLEDHLGGFLVAKSEKFCMNMYIHIYKNVYPKRKHQNISTKGWLSHNLLSEAHKVMLAAGGSSKDMSYTSTFISFFLSSIQSSLDQFYSNMNKIS